MSEDSKSFDSSSTRRKLLQSMGATGVAGLAGCSGSGKTSKNGTSSGGSKSNSKSGGGSSTGGSGRKDATFTVGLWDPPQDWQWNHYNLKSRGRENIFFDPLGKYDQKKDKIVPYLAKDWTIKDKLMTIQLRDQKWHNGDPVVADDLLAQFKLGKYVDDRLWDFTKSVESTDKHTVKLNFLSTVNSDVIEHIVLRTRLYINRNVYGKYIKKLENASSDSEKKKATQELLQWAPDHPVGNSPFKWNSSEVQKTRMKTDVFDDHPIADKIDYAHYGGVLADSNQKRWESLKNNQTNGYGSTYTPTQVLKGFPDSVTEIRHPIFTDYALTFKMNDPVFGKKEVRQALAYALDRNEVSQAIGPHTRDPIKVQTGIAPRANKKYIGDELSKYNKYNKNTDKAESLLKKAGLTKQSGTWHEPDGKVFAFDISICSGCSDFVSATQDVVSQLKDIGIQANIKPVEGSKWSNQWINGNFRVQGRWWGAWGMPHPYFALRHNFSNQEAMESAHVPKTMEVPMPIGKPDGKTQKINVRDTVAQMSKETDSQKEKELIRKMSWVFNQTLPRIQISERNDQEWLNSKSWNFPEKDDPVYGVHYAVNWLPRNGKLHPK